MAILCRFGQHSWNGCVCMRCGDTRDREHDFSKNCRICGRCGQTRANAHDFTLDRRKCSKCGQNSSWTRKRDPDAVIKGVADDLWSWDWVALNEKGLSGFKAHDMQDFTAGCAARGYDTAVDFFRELLTFHPGNELILWNLAWAVYARHGSVSSLEVFRQAAALGGKLVKLMPNGGVQVLNGLTGWWVLNPDGSAKSGLRRWPTVLCVSVPRLARGFGVRLKRRAIASTKARGASSLGLAFSNTFSNIKFTSI
jgi:hypothetical protein